MRAVAIVLLLMSLFSAASSERRGLEGLIKQVEASLEQLHAKRASFTLELPGPAAHEVLEQYRAVLGQNLSALYFYDAKRVLTTSIVEEGLSVQYGLLHENFLQITGRGGDGYYLSGLIPLKGKSYYFIGLEHGEGHLLLLYRLNFEPGAPSFLVFSSKGGLLVNNGVNAEGVELLSGQKDSFFSFNFFKEYDNYYYIEDREEPEQ